MDNTKFVLIVIGIIVVLYLLYKYNGSDFDSEHMEEMTNVNSASKDADVSSSSNNKPKVGVYYTEWCGYSRQFLEALKNGVSDAIEKAGAKVVLVDCEKDKETCAKYNVEGFPTILLHVNGKNIPYDGARDAESITKFINQNK
jgi:thioredoxin-like negative regulator of GroEL